MRRTIGYFVTLAALSFSLGCGAKNALRFRIAWCVLLALANGCGDPPTGPARIPGPVRPVETTFTVSNGWTREPVAGARVSANDTQLVTDSAGQVRLMKGERCVTVEVVASGFLERRTCAMSEITLWPVADAAEREATRLAAFSNSIRYGGGWNGPVQVMLSPELRLREDVVQTWRGAANEIRQLTLGRYNFLFVAETPDPGYIIAEASSPPVCDFRLQWPLETSGFCTEYADYSFLIFHVVAARLTDGSVALRALLTSPVGMGSHPAPGLLNSGRPDQNLSEFERKTLHMIGLRKGVDVQWPDFDIREIPPTAFQR